MNDRPEHLELHVRRFAGRLERYRCLRDPSQLDAAGRRFAMERRLAALEATLEARRAISKLARLPIEQLQRRFGLSDPAIQLLIGAAAPGLDLAVGRTIAELNGDRPQCDVGFLCGVLAEDPVDQRLLLGELGELAPLVRYRLIRIGAPRGWLPSCSRRSRSPNASCGGCAARPTSRARGSSAAHAWCAARPAPASRSRPARCSIASCSVPATAAPACRRWSPARRCRARPRRSRSPPRRGALVLELANASMDDVLSNIERQAAALQKVSNHFGKSIHVHCWLRPPAYNKLIGGAGSSAHLRGTATDFHMDGITAEAVRKELKASPKLYPGTGENHVSWVHIDLEHHAWFSP